MPVISGGVSNGLWDVRGEEVTVTETGGALTYTGSVTVPAGSYLIDIILHGTAVWNNSGAVTGKVGDATITDGIFTGIDMKATDLIAAEGLSASGVAGSAGGKAGGDLANSQWNRRWLATERVISLVITTASTGGSTGRTRMLVLYAAPPANSIAATSA